ncbi:MAG: energy transducer TonB [Acidobacteriota bacterium]
MKKQVIRTAFAALSLTVLAAAASAQGTLTARANLQPTGAEASGENDRARDGLVGPVRRVRTEVVKLSNVGGKTIEDNKRVLLETSEYDLKGTKTQNQYFPVAGATLTGREVYKYDEKGNISEMTLVNADGSLVSKEMYKYDFDSIGNWVKMTSSLAVVENGRIGFEPTEVTYRTIFYYLDATMAKMIEPSSTSRPENETKKAAAVPPPRSFDKSKVLRQAVTVDFQNTHLEANRKSVAVVDDAPPAPRPPLRPMSGGVLNGKALQLPSPQYPEVARRLRVTGLVQVEVVVDENGKVISAHAMSGPSSLREVAVQAAMRARFTPTKLSGQSIKVAGLINYNFTLQ